jgi:hypothetical protein
MNPGQQGQQGQQGLPGQQGTVRDMLSRVRSELSGDKQAQFDILVNQLQNQFISSDNFALSVQSLRLQQKRPALNQLNSTEKRMKNEIKMPSAADKPLQRVQLDVQRLDPHEMNDVTVYGGINLIDEESAFIMPATDNTHSPLRETPFLPIDLLKSLVQAEGLKH